MNDIRFARALGWFSIGLGLMQLLAPAWLGRRVGVETHQRLLRAVGMRELITGISILLPRTPTAGVWGRVAGDLMDITLLAKALTTTQAQQRRVLGGTVLVLVIALLDLVCAQQLRNR